MTGLDRSGPESGAELTPAEAIDARYGSSAVRSFRAELEAMTPSQTIGPLYGFSLMFGGSDRTVAADDPDAVTIEGSVIDGAGNPLCYPNAMIEVWEGDQFARTRSDRDGRYRATLRRPTAQKLPDGESLAPHFNVIVFGPGILKPLHTRVFFPDEAEANSADPILQLVPQDRRDRLVAAEGDGATLRFDIYLQGPQETVFFDF
jgi:protocatechuate 3,4-dioxygenase alpha subunit